MTAQNLFIIGNPRSGTSLFRMMMTSHSQVIVPPECGLIQWWYPKYKGWNSSQSQSKKAIANFISDLKSSKKIETWSLDYDQLSDLIQSKRPETYAEMCNLVIYTYGLSMNKTPIVLGDKNNYYIDHLGLIKKIYPKAKFLVIYRDVRDVVCSYLDVNALKSKSAYKPKFPQTAELIAKEWLENNLKIEKFLAELNKENYVKIKYENLLIQPQKTLQKCLGIFNLGFEDNMLRYYESQLEPDALLDWKTKTNQPLDTSVIGRYKSQLNSEQINSVELIANKLMAKFGYLK